MWTEEYAHLSRESACGILFYKSYATRSMRAAGKKTIVCQLPTNVVLIRPTT